MNDATPHRLRGTLIERAAQRYDLSPRSWSPPAGGSFAPLANPGAPALVAERRLVAVDRDGLAARGMLVPGGRVGALAEEFRLVKRQILADARRLAPAAGDKARMVLVCSAKPDDGKTFCAVNLALSLAAERETEVLLVDADFAKPDVLATLGVDGDAAAGPGLLDAIGDPAVDAEGCILATDIPQLLVLPAGTRSADDTELVASEAAHRVIARLATANRRRILIFDSPPALAASPAAALSSHVGQTIVVVRADRTSEGDLRAAVALLDGCDHVQLLLNAVAFQPGGRRFDGDYGQEAQP